MTLKDLNDFVERNSIRPQSEYEDYEIIIAGHPGEKGQKLNESHVTLLENLKEIYIWIT